LYGPVPPVAIDVAVPLDPLKQETGVFETATANAAAGWVIVKVAV